MGKVLSFDEVLKVAEDARSRGLSIVATNGCYDILHVGHARNLYDAKALGDILIVGINSDASVQANKGPTRPIISETERAELIAALESVDYVFIFPEKTPFNWIRVLRPTIHVKGGAEDVLNHPDFSQMEDAINDAGAKLVLVPHHDGRSTSDVIKRIKES